MEIVKSETFFFFRGGGGGGGGGLSGGEWSECAQRIFNYISLYNF